MFSLYNLKNEFKRYIYESKSYGVDYFSSKLGDLIYLSGLFMILSYNYQIIDLTVILRFLTWYILYNASLNAVADGEFEIRADFFKNLTYTKTSIWTIYLNRYIVYSIEAIIVFTISFGIINMFINFDLTNNINSLNLIVYIIISTAINLMIYYSLISLTFIFERTMTFASLVMTFILFLSGMVFNFNNIFSNMLLANISKILIKPVTGLPIALTLLLTIPVYTLVKYTDRYIYK